MAVKKGKVVPVKKGPRVEVVMAPMSFKDFTIKQKPTGRFEVVNTKGKNINGEEKVKLLLEAKVLKGSFKKAAAETAPAAN